MDGKVAGGDPVKEKSKLHFRRIIVSNLAMICLSRSPLVHVGVANPEVTRVAARVPGQE